MIGSGSEAPGHRSSQRELNHSKGHNPVAALVRGSLPAYQGTAALRAGSLVSWQLIDPCLRLGKRRPPPQHLFVPSVN